MISDKKPKRKKRIPNRITSYNVCYTKLLRADAYREWGWYQAQATVDLEEVDEGRAVIVHFHVNEGKPVLLDDWALTLADDADLTQADRATLQAQIPSERGQPS